MAVVAAGLAIAIATATGSFGGGEDMPVFTEPVVLGTVEETVLANGVLEPSSIVSVGAQVSGQLKTLHVTLGQRVKEGELIAEIDSTVQTNALRIAEAGLANVKAQRNARGIQLRQADQAYDRLRTLNEKRAASTADFETATAAFLTLKAEVEALDAQIAQSSVEVENARANLGYTKVRAPMDGVVVAVVTKAGQTLNANQAVPTIVVLAQLDVMRVKVQISEADIARVKQGQEVRFTIMGDTHNPIAGVLQQIEPAPVSIVTDSANASMGTQAAPAAVYFNGLFETPNKEGRLRPDDDGGRHDRGRTRDECSRHRLVRPDTARRAGPLSRPGALGFGRNHRTLRHYRGYGSHQGGSARWPDGRRRCDHSRRRGGVQCR